MGTSGKTWVKRRDARGTQILETFVLLGKVVRPERVELPTFWFVAKRSIQLSYGRPDVRVRSK